MPRRPKQQHEDEEYDAGVAAPAAAADVAAARKREREDDGAEERPQRARRDGLDSSEARKMLMRLPNYWRNLPQTEEDLLRELTWSSKQINVNGIETRQPDVKLGKRMLEHIGPLAQVRFANMYEQGDYVPKEEVERRKAKGERVYAPDAPHKAKWAIGISEEAFDENFAEPIPGGEAKRDPEVHAYREWLDGPFRRALA